MALWALSDKAVRRLRYLPPASSTHPGELTNPMSQRRSPGWPPEGVSRCETWCTPQERQDVVLARGASSKIHRIPHMYFQLLVLAKAPTADTRGQSKMACRSGTTGVPEGSQPIPAQCPESMSRGRPGGVWGVPTSFFSSPGRRFAITADPVDFLVSQQSDPSLDGNKTC